MKRRISIINQQRELPQNLVIEGWDCSDDSVFQNCFQVFTSINGSAIRMVKNTDYRDLIYDPVQNRTTVTMLSPYQTMFSGSLRNNVNITGILDRVGLLKEVRDFSIRDMPNLKKFKAPGLLNIQGFMVNCLQMSTALHDVTISKPTHAGRANFSNSNYRISDDLFSELSHLPESLITGYNYLPSEPILTSVITMDEWPFLNNKQITKLDLPSLTAFSERPTRGNSSINYINAPVCTYLPTTRNDMLTNCAPNGTINIPRMHETSNNGQPNINLLPANNNGWTINYID